MKGDPTPVTDDVTDFVEPEENLLVFGGKLPENDQMRRIDTLLVKQADPPEVKDEAQWRTHQKAAIERLRQLTFRHVARHPSPRRREFRSDGSSGGGTSVATYVFDTSDGLTLDLRTARPAAAEWPIPTVAYAVQADAPSTFSGGGRSRPALRGQIATAGVEVRNTGVTSVGPGYLWTLRRIYPMLGHTLPERQVQDLLDGIAVVRQEAATGPVAVFGRGARRRWRSMPQFSTRASAR